MTRVPRSRGIVLVLVSSLLTLLVLCAWMLVRVSASVRDTTRTQVAHARAGLLARSGIESAASRLSRAPEPLSPARRGNQADDWTYRDATTVPLERAQNPSYASGEGYDDAPPLDGRYAAGTDIFLASHDRNRNGSREGISGRLRGTNGTHGDTYALRIESEEGKLYVNGGYLTAADGNPPLDPANGTPDRCDRNAGYNAMLHRVLNLLGAHADVNVPGLGDLVIDNRPVGGYRTLADLPVTAAQRARLAPYLTCHAWVDRSVIRPQLDRELGPGVVWSSGASRWGRADHIAARGGAPALEPTGRAPVNANLAPRAVLEALLNGLQGGFLFQGWEPGFFPPTWHYKSSNLNAASASAIAARIVEFRSGTEDTNRNGYLDAGEDADADGYLDAPFATWAQFNAFCDTLARKGEIPSASFGTLNREVQKRLYAEILKANFNPNADLNKTGPDWLLYRDVDKSDLTVYSTEFSLHPISGTYSVASLGRVRDAAAGILSESRQETLLRLFVPLRQTTQQDFVGGRAPASSYITAANYAGMSPDFRTFGARAGLAGAGRGLSLMSYPEPYPALPARAAGFDGKIGLATTELPVPDPAGTRFIHRFTNTWTADKATAPGTTALSPIALTDLIDGVNVDALLQTDLTRSTFDATRPNTFVPDGVFAQRRRMPMYASVGNLPPRHGVLSYWVKPDVMTSTNGRLDFSVQQASRPSHAVTQTLCVGAGKGGQVFSHAYGLLVENAASAEQDSWHERTPYASQWLGRGEMSSVIPLETPWGNSATESRHEHRWILVTAQWDLDVAPDYRDNAALWVRGRWERASQHRGDYLTAFAGTPPTDLPNASRRLVIGGACMHQDDPADPSDYAFMSLGPHQIMDELAVYDYGADPVAARGSADILSRERYGDGRYYKRNDGQFTSTDLLTQLPVGTGLPLRVSRMFWTQILPRQPVNDAGAPGASLSAHTPPVWDDALFDARLGIEILQGAGAGVVLHNTETPTAPPQPLDSVAASRVGRTVAAGPLRYRVTFKPTPNWAAADPRYLDEPILESPWFDDITVLVQPRGYPRTVSWTAP